ncbi:hemerythrin domain-containing protein [Sphaerisporangium sp. TRM90804]|uniref:hemerythrin domain-containing protein n=1 Tax=Sphaerisporangium sp. TRM90804 TaxID=3031113 RepID=UPI00244AD564|nr:hemerythrin domain-containing protein [Sphaerisporangium sp. TRM90804]MDH2424920.1 hemerythrin domain-containing protein [Sphaerisporangium sp. TRM90804]
MDDRQATPEVMNENDVIDLLVRQHAMIQELFAEVRGAVGDEREEAFQRLVRLLAVHETAEEEIVHPYARLLAEDGGAVVDRRLDEEKHAKMLLTRLERAGTGHPDFAREFLELRNVVLAHAWAEERDEFPLLLERTNPAERRAMAAGVRAAEALAPTHPHPGVESAARNLLLGPTAALIDRARDVVRMVMNKQV